MGGVTSARTDVEDSADLPQHRIAEESSDGVRCYCGAQCGNKVVWALHAEQEGGGPYHASGWSTLAVNTVPAARLAQPGTIASNSFPAATCSVISLREDAGEEGAAAEALRSAIGAFLERTQSSAASLGLSARALELLGADSPGRCPAFSVKRSVETGEVLLPASGGDVLLWVKGTDQEWCADVCGAVASALEPWADATEETRCSAFGGKDLTGFVDGTGNPDTTLRPLADAALQPDGGSVLFAGRFVHNLAAFGAMDKARQSAIIGRDICREARARGLDGRVENPRYFTPDLRGHILRAWGEMYRQAMPYRRGGARGAEGDEGLMFVAVAANYEEVESALQRMCGEFAHLTTVGKDSGHDNIFRISRAVSASYFYVPPMEELVRLSGGAPLRVCKPASGLPAESIADDVRGDMQGAHCPNCQEHSTFLLPAQSDFVRCLLCRRLFIKKELAFPPPKL